MNFLAVLILIAILCVFGIIASTNLSLIPMLAVIFIVCAPAFFS